MVTDFETYGKKRKFFGYFHLGLPERFLNHRERSETTPKRFSPNKNLIEKKSHRKKIFFSGRKKVSKKVSKPLKQANFFQNILLHFPFFQVFRKFHLL